MSRRAIIAALLVLVTCTGCGSSSTAKSRPSDASPTAPRLTDIKSVGELRTSFNAHAGEPRLILLMSPT